MTPEEYEAHVASLRAEVAAMGDGWIYIGDKLFERGQCVQLFNAMENLIEYPRVVDWDPELTDGDYIAWRVWEA